MSCSLVFVLSSVVDSSVLERDFFFLGDWMVVLAVDSFDCWVFVSDPIDSSLLVVRGNCEVFASALAGIVSVDIGSRIVNIVSSFSSMLVNLESICVTCCDSCSHADIVRWTWSSSVVILSEVLENSA